MNPLHCRTKLLFPPDSKSLLNSKFHTSILCRIPNTTKSCYSMITHLIKRDNLDEARRVFDRIQSPDVYQYTMMITGYYSRDRFKDALQMFGRMPHRDTVSWNSIIRGSMICGELRLAQNFLVKMLERNVVSWTTVVDGLGRLGRIEAAEKLFLQMPTRDAAAWNSMISGYCRNGRISDALSLFEKMPSRNVISWTAIIGGLDQNGQSEEALSMFPKMLSSGVRPASDTFSLVLIACSNAKNLCLGSQVHVYLTKSGNVLDTFVSTSLITLYANCNQMENSCKILQEDQHKTVVTWTALITGYGSNGEYQFAVDAFFHMKRSGILPNQSTFTSALNSCGMMEDLDAGVEIHGNATKIGFGYDVFVGNSLIFMYSKCGHIDDALSVFSNLNERNLVSWNSVITGCAQNGRGPCALELYRDMVLNLVQPDEITYLGLLTACSHSKMVDKARYFYRALTQDSTVEIKLEHCICMVDALCRSGYLVEAENFINTMPLKPNAAIWLSLLSACRTYLNTDIAMRAAEKIFDIEPDCTAAYVLLSNIYASCGQWDDASQIRVMMRCSGLSKMPGFSGLS